MARKTGSPREGGAWAERGSFARFQPAGDRAADGEDRSRHQQQPGHQMQKGHLRRVDQHQRSGRAAQKSSRAHRHSQAQILANVVAVGGNRGQLARPHGHRVGGVGLDGQHLHPQHRRKGEERAAARHGIQHPSQKRRHGEPKPVPVKEWRKAERCSICPHCSRCPKPGSAGCKLRNFERRRRLCGSRLWP